MQCAYCGAPLPPKSDICRYCNALNDTDLRALHFHTTHGPESPRVCPRCESNLQTVEIGIKSHFYIERCSRCLGIFFDPGEIESIVDQSVANVYDIDFRKLQVLIDERRPEDQPVAYIKCPVCSKFMNRKSYGVRSGVIVDVCKEHGAWLDGGELGAILRWAKAGGYLHAERRTEEKQRMAKKEAARRESGAASDPSTDDVALFRLLSRLTS